MKLLHKFNSIFDISGDFYFIKCDYAGSDFGIIHK